MKEILRILPVVLYMLVGFISVVMALKNFSSKKFLPFYEQASGKHWEDIDDPVKIIILSLMKLVGLGFLTQAILMTVFPLVNYFSPDPVNGILIPAVAFLFCTGLFAVNFSLFKKTKAETPWKGSLYAMVILLIGMIVSTFN